MKTHYYLVWNTTSGRTSKRHETILSAQAEAIRLAKLNPNETFVILKAINEYSVEPLKLKVVHLLPPFV